MKPTTDPQPDRAPDHRRYWVNAKQQPMCADCFPPPRGAAVIHVGSFIKDEIYEREERLGIQEG